MIAWHDTSRSGASFGADVCDAFTVILPGASIVASPQITGDLVLLHQEADAGVHAAGDPARALDHGGCVEFHIIGRQAVVLSRAAR